MDSRHWIMIVTMAVYLLAMIWVGLRCSRRNRSADDFYLGGRRLGPVVTAMSAEASDMSSWLLMGLPGLAYFTGLADPFWTALGLALGTWLNWLIVARRLRRYSERIGAATLPDFYQNRFGRGHKAILLFSALFIVIFFIPYTASGFAACGKLFSHLFPVGYQPAMVISAVVIVLYTTTGGFLAASTTDLIQSVIMSGALLAVLLFGLHMGGGVQAVADNAAAVPGFLQLSQMGNIATGEVTSYGPLKILSMLSWGLGYFGMPHVLLRFMAIEDDRKLRTSRRIATVWVVISMAAAVFIGVIGYSMTLTGKLPAFGSASQAESLIVETASLLSRFGFPAAVLGGLILAGILASTMSTADSQLLAAASSVSENLLGGVLGSKLSEKRKLLAARITVTCIAAVAVFLARDPDSSVFQIVSFAWAGFGAVFSPVMLCSLFWRRTTRQGALCGMIAGGAMVFIWEYLVTPFGLAHNIPALTIYELLPAFLTGLLVIVVVSLLTPEPEKEVLEDFDACRSL